MVTIAVGDTVVVTHERESFAPRLGQTAVVTFASKNGFIQTQPHLGANGFMWSVKRFEVKSVRNS